MRSFNSFLGHEAVMYSFNDGFQGRDVKFSPFHHERLAVATYDPIPVPSGERLGRGRLLIIDNFLTGTTIVNSIKTSRGLSQCTWSRFNQRILIVVGDDLGLVSIFDPNGSPPSSNPIAIRQAHESQISSIVFNPNSPVQFLTSAGELNVKLWTVGEENFNINSTLSIFNDDYDPIYSSIWNPNHTNIFACAGTCGLRIYDIREQRFVAKTELMGESFISCDWCKYNENFIATASKFHNCIQAWDVRHTANPYTVHGIETAKVIDTGSSLNKVKFLPHSEECLIASCSENSEVALWNYQLDKPLIKKFVHHEGPVHGLDTSRSLMASTGPDGFVHVWKRSLDGTKL